MKGAGSISNKIAAVTLIADRVSEVKKTADVTIFVLIMAQDMTKYVTPCAFNGIDKYNESEKPQLYHTKFLGDVSQE